MCTHLCLIAALYFPETLTLFLGTSICSREDYKHLTGMSVIYRWIVPSSVESNIAGNLNYEVIKLN